MSLMTAIEVGASGLAAQRKRIDVLVGNLTNANTTNKPDAEPFRRKDVVFRTATPAASFGATLDEAVQGVEVSEIWTDYSSGKKVSDPNHPDADPKTGMVSYPNVNPLAEMVEIMNAARSYEANLQAVNMAKDMQQKTLEILR
jgi:flagellar basal-body rod protein FlgC